MEALGKVVAIGVTPCAKGAHKMRTRSGHCVFCNPPSLEYQERWSRHAFVYVAGSLSLKVVKIGFATDVRNRISSLNSLRYADANDWKLIYWAETKNAGRNEYEAHKILAKYASPQKYSREGRYIDCLETFSCDAHTALNAVKKTAAVISEWTDERTINDYLFQAKTGSSFVRKTGERTIAPAKPLIKSPNHQYLHQSGLTKQKTLPVVKRLPPTAQNQRLLKDAELGDTEAQYCLGEIYLGGIECDGVSVLPDYSEALKWSLRAAENNHSTAQYHVATIYSKGLGIPPDLIEAYAWASLAIVSNEFDFCHEPHELRDSLEATLKKVNKLAQAITRAAKIIELVHSVKPANGKFGHKLTNGSVSSLTVVCPICDKQNRLPLDGLHHKPLCGHRGCRSSLIVKSLEFTGYKVVCPKCGKANQLKTTLSNNNPICGHRSCRFSLVREMPAAN